LLRAMAEACGDVLFSGGVGNGSDGKLNEKFIAFLADVRASAGRITTAGQNRPSGSLCGLAQIAPVKGKRWRALMQLPTIADRVAALKDQAVRAELVAEGEAKGLWYDPMQIYPLGLDTVPDFAMDGAEPVGVLAERAGVSPVNWMIDRLLESDGRELFNTWFFSRNHQAIPEFMNLEHAYPGLADTGAHAGQICDADSSTFLLSYWQRDKGVMSLESAVRKLTAQAAEVLGLRDRGTVEVGRFADLNVFDVDRLATRHPQYVNDFPGGAGRLQVRSDGYVATIVNGTVVTEEGEVTGARPGRVLREFSRS
jgi:N-acyl-D-amino-acid deacylase